MNIQLIKVFNILLTLFAFYEGALTFDIANDSLFTKPKKLFLASMMGGKSHIKLHLEIGKELQRRGHSVSYASSSDQIHWADSYNFSKIDLGPNPVSDELHRKVITKLTKRTLAYDTLTLFTHAGVELSYKMVYEGLKQEFKNNKPDLIICDFLLIACFDVASEMNVTYAGSFPSLGFIDQTAASYITNRFEILPPTTSDLTFFEKLLSTIYTPIAKKVLHLTICYQLNSIRNKIGAKPIYGNAWQKLDRAPIFVDTFFGFDAARPLPPLIQPIGPIVPESYPPLSKEFIDFFSSKSKIIYIAFGTIVFLDPYQATAIIEGIILAIDQGLADGAIWSVGNTLLSSLPTHVTINGKPTSIDNLLEKYPIKIVEYAPQISILNHPSTILFISHCGIESSFEGLLSGIPILAIPFFGDQLINAANLVSNHVGLAIHHSKLTSQSLLINIERLTKNLDEIFKENILRMKNIAYAASFNKFSSADMIERIMFLSASSPEGKNPLAHLVTADNDMNIFFVYNLDVYIFFIITLVTLWYLLQFLYRILIKFKCEFQASKKTINHEYSFIKSKVN